MSWYRAGTIQVTNGSTSVVGTSTAFIANVAIGEGLLAPDGKVYEIASVNSDTTLTLGSAYLGSNASGQAYAIIPSQSYVRDLATQAATLVNSYQTVKDNAGAGKFGDGTVGSPGVQFLSDSDTGIRRTGANAIALVTGGADRVTLDANGTLAVTNSSSSNAMVITQTGAGNAFVVEDSASTDSTPFVIDANGYVVSGATQAYSAGTIVGVMQSHGTSVSVGAPSAYLWTNDANGAISTMAKSRGATVGTHTVVQSGDVLGQVRYFGSDGTQFIQAAQIRADVDGTPGTNDMPGRLVFSTTADGASSPTERMRIDSAGKIGIAAAPTAGYQITIAGTASGATSTFGIGSIQAVDPAVSSAFHVGVQTANSVAAGTLPDLRGFNAHQGTFTGTVTNQYGFFAQGTLVGATNNYGFYSNIAAASNRYNFYAGGTADNYFAGKLNLGTNGYAGTSFVNGRNVTGSTVASSMTLEGFVQSDVTSIAIGSNVTAQTAAASFTLSSYRLHQAQQGIFGAGSSITSQFGFFADSSLTGATNNYGFYSNIAAASNRYNLYCAGTAPNYFAGTTTIASNLILPKTTTTGIQVDTASPTWGWRDITADIQVRGTGANDPTFATYGATAMRQYSFSATVENEVFLVFHMPHDYVPGTQIYIHAHWSNAAATPNTGGVVWGFDYAFARGFNQGAFPAFTSITVTQASPATRYQHMVAETTGITIANLEVDGLILVRCYRKVADAGDTCTDAVFLHTADVHYQSTNMATKAKAPSFYT